MPGHPAFTLPTQLDWPKQQQLQPHPSLQPPMQLQSPFFAPQPQPSHLTSPSFSAPMMDVNGPGSSGVTSRYFTQRVQAISDASSASPQAVSSAAPPVKTLLFSSQSLSKLRPLLQYGQTASAGSSSLPYPPPQPSLSARFHLKQSASIPSDLLITGAKSVAFVVVTDKELDSEEHRNKFTQRCTTLQRQQRYLFVLHLKDGANQGIALEELGKHATLPPILHCSNLSFAVQCICAVQDAISGGKQTAAAAASTASASEAIAI